MSDVPGDCEAAEMRRPWRIVYSPSYRARMLEREPLPLPSERVVLAALEQAHRDLDNATKPSERERCQLRVDQIRAVLASATRRRTDS